MTEISPAHSLTPRAPWQRIWPVVLMCGLFIGALIWALPIAPLPKPTGPFAVGTATYRFLEPERGAPSSKARQDRELAVQIWYPAQVRDEVTATYMAPLTDREPFLRAPLFALLATHLTRVKTHSHINASVNSAKPIYPVLIFSHGLMGGRIQNTTQMEELASYGYIIAAIDHTFDASFSIFPDGHVVTSELLALNSSSRTMPPVDVIQRVKDVDCVIGELSKLNASDPRGLLTKRLDLKNIGVFGHSMGGRTALMCCSVLPFKAGISYDGGDFNSAPLKTPFMVMQANRAGDPLGVNDLHAATPDSIIYNVRLFNSGHANFTDLPLITPLHWIIGLSGSIDQPEAERTINAYTLCFFGKYLKGIDEEPASFNFAHARCTTNSQAN